MGQQRQTEALIPPKDEQAGTALSNVAAFLANAWRRSHCPRPFPSSGRRKPVPALFLDSHLLPLQAAMGMGPALSCFLAPDSSPEEKGEHPHLSLCHPGLIYREKQLTAASFAKQIMQKKLVPCTSLHVSPGHLSAEIPGCSSRVVHNAVAKLKPLPS